VQQSDSPIVDSIIIVITNTVVSHERYQRASIDQRYSVIQTHVDLLLLTSVAPRGCLVR